MGKHRVRVSTPQQELSTKDVTSFDVEEDGEKLGEFSVGRFGIGWKPRGAKQVRWKTWSQVNGRLFAKEKK